MASLLQRQTKTPKMMLSAVFHSRLALVHSIFKSIGSNSVEECKYYYYLI